MRSLSRAISVSAFMALAACGGSNSGVSVPAPVVTTPPVQTPSFKNPAFLDQTGSKGFSFSSGFDASYAGMPSLFAGGAAIGDVDGDTDLDLFIVRGDLGPNLLMLNDGSGSFSRSTLNSSLDEPAGAGSNYKWSGPLFADFDQDGDLDLFVGGLDGDPSRLYLGDGVGGFTDGSVGSGIDTLTSENTISATAGDYDGDGDLDIALAHWGTARSASNPGETETLLRNDLQTPGGSIVFTPVSDASGISAGLGLNVDGKIGRDRDYSFVPNFSDIDADGDLDLLLVADFFSSRVFQNNGDGTFSNITDPTQITDTNGMGTDVGDFNNSGRPDWFVSSINGNRLYRNINNSLIDLPTAEVSAGSWGWGSCFADFNLDGHLDIYQTNGWINDTGAAPTEPYTADRSRLWMNDGDNVFEDMADTANMVDTIQGRAVVCDDFDDDLDVDVLLLVNNSSDGAIYWENRTVDTNAISIRLNGKSTNKQGIGAKITIETASDTQTRWVRAGSTFTAQTSPSHVVGLGELSQASRIIVEWADGEQSILTSVASGTRLVVDHPG